MPPLKVSSAFICGVLNIDPDKLEEKMSALGIPREAEDVYDMAQLIQTCIPAEYDTSAPLDTEEAWGKAIVSAAQLGPDVAGKTFMEHMVEALRSGKRVYIPCGWLEASECPSRMVFCPANGTRKRIPSRFRIDIVRSDRRSKKLFKKGGK